MIENITAIPNMTFNGTDIILNQYICPNLVNANPSFTMLSIFIVVIIASRLLKEINEKYKFTTYNLDVDEIVLICCLFLLAKYPLDTIQIVLLGLGLFAYFRQSINSFMNKYIRKKNDR